VEALSEALARFGKPGIFNTDQGAQFTSEEFTKMLRDHGIEISMDGRGRCHDNIIRRSAGEHRTRLTSANRSAWRQAASAVAAVAGVVNWGNGLLRAELAPIGSAGRH
jgi:transposase InsO family protein